MHEFIGWVNWLMLKAVSNEKVRSTAVNKDKERNGVNKDAERPIMALFSKSLFRNATPADKDGTNNAFECTEIGDAL